MKLDSTRVTVKKSPGKGRGVFAVKKISTGGIVEVVPTLSVPHSSRHNILSTDLSSHIFEGEEGRKGPLVIALGYGSLYNHSGFPNAEFDVLKGKIKFTALRPIAKGEEITIDYGWDDEEYELAGFKKW
jgi:SET domain-containing protein